MTIGARLSTGPAAPQPKHLTPRELEIMDLVADGHNNFSIANQLDIAEETVKHHIWRIFPKVGAVNRVELASKVWQQRHAAEVAKIHEHYKT